ncbi:Branched-chain-amino-acid aminotransferase [Frondihabitans sp. 762G35]|uniref:aminotransferase class IV n=1 Tax=Frondihabitans sp. 762G35 TaxID=1446794 RepID=UPI000D204D46|nr:aminotransferase class IV [Frondihabitans sp. 762G35]ARC57121.1 Branched-chain-amino-acid aminotransferase [Frondihabitans sp. 762G35]
MSAARNWVWSDGSLARVDAAEEGVAPAERVLVSDSWVADGGRTLALDVHRDRFLASVEAADPGLVGEATAFWEAAVAVVPAAGSWWPRFDLVDAAAARAPFFRAAVRPAPERRLAARLVTASHDPRRSPLTKGPDLEALLALRAEAHERGADEAVILSPEGLVVEGNYASIVWWSGDALCVVADELPRLPGVTERSLVTLATALGVEVRREVVAPEDLDGVEVWILNALHGARIATAWEGGPALAEEPGRLRTWRSRLARLARPLPEAATR